MVRLRLRIRIRNEKKKKYPIRSEVEVWKENTMEKRSNGRVKTGETI